MSEGSVHVQGHEDDKESDPVGSDRATEGDRRTQDAPDSPARSSTRNRPVPTGIRGFLRRRDPVAWSIGGLSMVLSITFVVVNLAYNAWNFIPPLDDVYIHLNYAEQLGKGHFLRYNTGDPISTGASSPLYIIILGALYSIGFRESALLPVTMGFGAICMALTAVCVYRTGSLLVSRTVGAWAGVLVALNGTLLWGSASGMEIGFVALMISATLLACTIEAPRGRFVLTPIFSLLAAFSRPEALVFVLALNIAAGWMVVRRARETKSSRMRTIGRIAPLLLPIVGYGGQMLGYFLATGSTSANGMEAKSLLYKPIFYPLGFLDESLSHFHEFLRVFTGLNTFDYVFPGALLVAIIGTVHLMRRPGRKPLALAIAFGFLLVLMAISTLRTALIHHLRYAQPFIPVLILMSVIGLYAVASVLRSRRNRFFAANVAFSMALLFTLLEMPSWALRLGQQSAGIRDQQVSITTWMRGHLPDNAVIAVNDVGAPAYLGDHHIVDLIGLTTNRLTAPNVNGPGSLYEALRDMPADQRPDYFTVFTHWPVHELKRGDLFADAPLARFTLKSPIYSHRTVGSASACQATRHCDEVVIYKADWSSVDTGDAPITVDPPGRVRDYVNVGDLRSEEDHEYRVDPAHREFQPMTSLKTVPYPNGPAPDGEVVDSGRRVMGGETVTAHGLEPGEPVTITSRVSASNTANSAKGPRRMRVVVNGVEVGTWSPEPTRSGWYESNFRIPGRLVNDSDLTVSLKPPVEFVGPYPDYVSYGFWFSQ